MMKRPLLSTISLGVVALLALGFVISQGSRTYVNDAYGYSIQIPSDLTLAQDFPRDADSIEFFVNGNDQREGDPIVSVRGYKLNAGETVGDLRAWITNELEIADNVEFESATVDGKDGVRVRYTGGGTTGIFQYDSVYVVHPNTRSVLAFISFGNERTEEFESLSENFLKNV